VISSLLFLQSEYVQDNKTREMFKESQNRVRSMASCTRSSTSRRTCRDRIQRVHQGPDAQPVHFHTGVRLPDPPYVEAEGITLGMDTGGSLRPDHQRAGVQFTEARLPRRGSGEIHVELSRSMRPGDAEPQEEGGGWYRLAVSDNGVGFPEGLDFRKTESLASRSCVRSRRSWEEASSWNETAVPGSRSSSRKPSVRGQPSPGGDPSARRFSS